MVQPSLLQGTNLAGSVDLCCCIRTRGALPAKEESVCVCVWCGLHGDRYGLEHPTSEPASSRRGCGLAEEAAPRACCSVVLGVRAAKKGQIVYITS